MRCSLSALAVLSCFIALPAQAYDPFLNWNTLNTEHFKIHYADEQAALAQTTARLAERIHQELSPQLAWQPATPTEIVIADDDDFANGNASPLPFNQIHVIVSPPEAGDFLEVTDETDWLYQLIRHEYTHILHLDAVSGAPAAIQKVLGRQLFTFPALLQPTWVIEGLATDTETDDARGVGRGHSSSMAMNMRAEVLAGVKPLSQVSMGGSMQQWPYGAAPYLYGVHFFEFLRDRYGEASIQRFIKNYRGNLIPFRIHHNARLTTGKNNMDALWAEFQVWLTTQYNPQIAAIKQEGIVEGEAITSGGQLQSGSSLQALPDGSVYYVRGNPNETHVLIQRLPNGEEIQISQVHQLARFDVHPSAGIVLAQPEACANERIYFDLYRIAPGANKPERLTHCARYRHVLWQTDGLHLIALKVVNGQSKIDQLSRNGRFEANLWTAQPNEKASQLTLSPDGKTLVFVRSQTGLGSDLVQLDLATQTLTALTQDRNAEVSPRYTVDGKALLFSSDHGGISNLRQLDLASGQISTLTNTLTGAFAPSQATVNGPIWYARYTANGYDLNRLDRPIQQALPAAKALDPNPIRVDDTQALAAPNRYNPFPGLSPRSWSPILGVDNARTIVGAAISGSDVLGVHNYQLSLARDFRNDSWVGGFSYLGWDRLILGLARNQTITTANNKTTRVRNDDTASLGLTLPWKQFEQRWAFTAGMVWEREADLWRETSLAPKANFYDGVAGVAITLNTTLPVRNAAGPTAGRQIQALWETSDALGRSNFSGQTTAVDWREYFNLGKARMLAARLAVAQGNKQIQPYALGGSFNSSPLFAPALPFNQRDIDLRSYASGQFSGHAYQLAALEWRTPLLTVDHTFTTPPIGLSRLTGSVFAETARTLNQSWSKWHNGIGCEVIGNVLLGYWIPLDVRLGLAYGLDKEDGGGRAYLSLGYGF